MTSKELKLFRKGIGWTQEQLADNLGVTRGHVTNCENENATLKEVYEQKIRTIAMYLHINLTGDDNG